MVRCSVAGVQFSVAGVHVWSVAGVHIFKTSKSSKKHSNEFVSVKADSASDRGSGWTQVSGGRGWGQWGAGGVVGRSGFHSWELNFCCWWNSQVIFVGPEVWPRNTFVTHSLGHTMLILNNTRLDWKYWSDLSKNLTCVLLVGRHT